MVIKFRTLAFLYFDKKYFFPYFKERLFFSQKLFYCIIVMGLSVQDKKEIILEKTAENLKFYKKMINKYQKDYATLIQMRKELIDGTLTDREINIWFSFF